MGLSQQFVPRGTDEADFRRDRDRLGRDAPVVISGRDASQGRRDGKASAAAPRDEKRDASQIAHDAGVTGVTLLAGRIEVLEGQMRRVLALLEDAGPVAPKVEVPTDKKARAAERARAYRERQKAGS